MRREFHYQRQFHIQPISFREATAFIAENHRYLPAPRGCKFCIATATATQIVAVAIVGRPISPHKQDGWTLEITRLATISGWQNAASHCIASGWKVAKALGYNRLISYIDADLDGESFIAAGFKYEVTRPRSGWHNRQLIAGLNQSQAVSLFTINASG